MTKHDYWKTTDTDGEDAVYRQERILDKFCREFGTWDNPENVNILCDGLIEISEGSLYSLLVAEFDKLTPDQQERFLGMDND